MAHAREEIDGVTPRAWAMLIRDFGFPMVVAGVLLWFLLSHVVPSTTALQHAIEANTRALQELRTAVQAVGADSGRASEAIRDDLRTNRAVLEELRRAMSDHAREGG